MKFSTSLGLISISIVFFVCGSCGLLGGEDDKKSSGDLMPLAVGNYWEYETTYYLNSALIIISKVKKK